MIQHKVVIPSIIERYRAHTLQHNSCCVGADMNCKNFVDHVGYIRFFACRTYQKVEVPDVEEIPAN